MKTEKNKIIEEATDRNITLTNINQHQEGIKKELLKVLDNYTNYITKQELLNSLGEEE